MILKIGGKIIEQWHVSASYGSVDDIHKMPHKGIDYAINSGTPIPSIDHARVVAVTDEGSKSFGKSVQLQLDNGDTVIYGHMNETYVQRGEIVNDGQIIGLSGNTGDSHGAHLHLQVMHNGVPVDPSPYVNSNFITKFFNNGKYVSDSFGHVNVTGINGGNEWYDRLLYFAWDKLCVFGHTLNDYSAMIVTFVIVGCSFMLMISPLTGQDSSKWYGRMFGAFIGGTMWRVLLHG